MEETFYTDTTKTFNLKLITSNFNNSQCCLLFSGHDENSHVKHEQTEEKRFSLPRIAKSITKD